MTASLSHTGFPQPLLDAPNVTNVTSSSVTITWDFPGGVVDFFVIQYKLRLIVWSDSGVENITISGTRDIVTINGLAADSSYDIRISTKNDLGVSEWSPAASFITLGKGSLIATVTLGEGPLYSHHHT